MPHELEEGYFGNSVDDVAPERIDTGVNSYRLVDIRGTRSRR